MKPSETTGEWPRPPFWMRIESLPEWIVASVMVAATTVGIITNAIGLRDGLPASSFAALSVGAAACLAAWRTQWLTLILAASSPLIASLVGINPILEWNLALFATFVLMMRGMSIWLSLIPAFSNYLSMVLHQMGSHDGWTAFLQEEAVAAGAATVLFATIGTSVVTSRRYWEQVTLRSLELSEAQDVAVARGVAEERLRIARDLHDVIGHEIAVVNIHLGAAEVHLQSDKSQVGQDLNAARGGIQRVLAETQKILKILRTSDESAAFNTDSTLSGYGEIRALIEQSAQAGIDVEASFPQDDPRLDPEVARAAFRVVQECLTNVTKYGTGSVALHVTTTPRWLELESVNRQDATRVHHGKPGYGLVGMHERVTSVGGTLKTSDADGLFWVRARLPMPVPPKTDGRSAS